MMTKYIDMFQIGARNMQNFELLKAVGKTGMPVLSNGPLRHDRGVADGSRIPDGQWNRPVVLCERGIRTYERATRNTLDVSAIPVVQKMTHLPVIGDHSHATGLRDMVSPMSLALIAGGASGLIVEVHDNPEKALSDGPQSLYPSQFEKLMRDLQALSAVVGKSLERIPRILPETLSLGKGPSVATDQLVVAFQGERGAYSELAIRRAFGESTDVLPCKSFPDVFEAVLQGRAAYGMIPLENTLGGTIYENLDLLDRHQAIQVVGEQQIRIIHNLIGLPGSKKENIREIYSHPQGLAQCTEYLQHEMSHAQAIPFFDTAGAVAYVKEAKDPTKAAIAGAPAAKVYGMEILAEGIESNPRNYTRFYIICRDERSAVFRSTSALNRASLRFTVPDRRAPCFPPCWS
jgi:prephenate dehydratase